MVDQYGRVHLVVVGLMWGLYLLPGLYLVVRRLGCSLLLLCLEFRLVFGFCDLLGMRRGLM